MSYDRAITVFSPNGHLFQVEYAMEAVRRGAVALCVVSKDTIVFGVEKKKTLHLQDPRTIRKIVKLDEHINLAFAGLTADSRQLIDRARVECQSHRLTFDEPATVEQIARFVAKTQQQFTQRGGRRPFGLSTLIAGFDKDGVPRLYQTDPSGTYSEWKACAIGRSNTNITNFLETLYFNEPPTKESERNDGKAKSKVASEEQLNTAQNEVDPIKVAIKVLLEVVENPLKNMEIALVTKDKPYDVVPIETIEKFIAQIKVEKEEMAKQVSRFFRTGDSSSSEEEVHSAKVSSEEESVKKIANVRSIVDSSSDDDKKRVVRSKKAKQFDELQSLCNALKPLIKNNDWLGVGEGLKELQRKLERSQTVIDQHGFPNFYIQSILELTRAAVVLRNDEDALDELKPKQRSAHELVIKIIQKHTKELAPQIDAYKKEKVAADLKRAQEESEEEEEDEDLEEDLEDEDAEEDADDEDAEEDAEDELDAMSDIDDDIDDVSMIMHKITRDFWVKKEKKEEVKVVPVKKVKVRNAAKKENTEEEDSNAPVNTAMLSKAQKQKLVLQQRASEEITPAAMAKFIREILANRGKKSADLPAIINELRFLESKSKDMATTLRIQTIIGLTLLEMNTKRGPVMSISSWRECITQIEVILNTLVNNKDIRLAEDEHFDDFNADEDGFDEVNLDDVVKDEESSAWFAERARLLEAAKKKAALKEAAANVVEDTGVTMVEGNLYYFVYAISNEFYKALQNTDQHSSEYITRLREQLRLVSLFKSIRDYYLSIGKTKMVSRVGQIWLEYEYYYYRPELDVLVTGSNSSIPANIVDELADAAYASEDPRARIRALLFQCYFWCVHNFYGKVKERLSMSHIQETIHELDVNTRILYNRTIVQFGLAAFRLGEYKSALNTLSDFYNSPQRIRELLAQPVRQHSNKEVREDDVIEAKKRMYPYHMHINIELVDAVHLISAMLVEIPSIAELGFGRRVASKTFRKFFQPYLSAFNNTVLVDTTRDIIMCASSALLQGDWNGCFEKLSLLKIWSSFVQCTIVKDKLLEKIKHEALRTFLLTNGSNYVSVSLDTFVEMFQLSKQIIIRVTSKMLHSEQLSGAWDTTVEPACLVISSPPFNALEKSAVQFVDRLVLFAERIDTVNSTKTNYNNRPEENNQNRSRSVNNDKRSKTVFVRGSNNYNNRKSRN